MSHNRPHHSHTSGEAAARLFITMALNLLITIAEIIGGIFSGSLSLISDALHNFSDTISFVVSYVAIKLKDHDTSYRHTFGLKRAEILAAVINSSVLIVISFFLFYEAIMRLMNPAPIDTNIMIIVALMGLLANAGASLLLKRDSVASINIRSSYLHLLSDAFASGAVILGGIAIDLWNVAWVDPALTILIGLVIIKESYQLLAEAVHVLMEGAPPEISLDEIKTAVEKFPEVTDIHHIHLWMVGDNDVHLEAHVNINDMKISESDNLRSKIERLLEVNFGIRHITLQFECQQCLEDGLIGLHK